jgi:S-adenosyl-L-methionine hydrolase (adenosine-forming)
LLNIEKEKRMTVITLTTDFGLRSGFAGVMQGVIYNMAPQVKIVDISHFVPPQDVREGAYTLERAVPFFPEGTIHVYVVDPGVGTARRPLAARLGNHFFVGPDNGLLTRLIEEAEGSRQQIEFVHLDRPQFWRPQISRTFHGRDIFAPVAAHLANDVPLHELGTLISDPVRLPFPRPQQTETGWTAHVISIDTFGNLTTDLPGSALSNAANIGFRLKGVEVNGISNSYGDRPAGEIVAVIDSEEFVEIAVVNGNAAQKLNAKAGDEVEVIFSVK